MGLFDTITCNYTVPDNKALLTNGCQTKNLGCQLDHYTITREGTLIWHYRGFSEAHNSQHKADVEIPYHGTLEFCCSNAVGVLQHYTTEWCEGKLETIVEIIQHEVP